MRNITPKKILLLSIIGFLFAQTFYFVPNLWFLLGHDVGEAIYLILTLFSVPLSLLSIIFFWSSDAIFNSWFKFARIYLLIAFILVVLAPTTGETGVGFSMGIDYESIAWTAAVLFLLISIILIVRKSLKLRKEKQTNSPFSTGQQK